MSYRHHSFTSYMHRKMLLFLCSPPPEGAQEATISQTADGQLPDGQWMTQSFADQIPDIGSGPKDGSI